MRIWAGFSMMCVGMFMAILDIQVVATSLPTIQEALGIPPDQMSWVQTAYLTAEVLAIPLTGLLTRLLTMRWLFVISVSVFTIASSACAASHSFPALVAWRAIQGASGGTLIPAVFSAVFLLFPFRRQGIATTIAGVLAVLAPTTGPVVGGWITQTFSWHWLFLINVAPGVLSAVGACWLLPFERPRRELLRELELASLALLAVSLSCLEIGLKDAPQLGWVAPETLAWLATSFVSALLFVRRTLASQHPVVDLGMLVERPFAVGSALSFTCGIGLFGSVYLMPVFLAFVRGHRPLEIGKVMLVTGLAQLATAPLAVALERRLNARLVALAGFGLFATGSALSATQTVATDYDGMFWPQIIRGLSIMLCLLAPTRLALGNLPAEQVPDASGLFNLMRNLGGAIGLALIDTVIYGRAPGHAASLSARLASGDIEAARIVGIPLAAFAAHAGAPVDPTLQAIVAPMVEKAALAESINEAWALVSAATLVTILALPFARAKPAAGKGV